jgi:hypothetical protein
VTLVNVDERLMEKNIVISTYIYFYKKYRLKEDNRVGRGDLAELLVSLTKMTMRTLLKAIFRN